MARQSFHQRFDIRSTALLMAVLCDLMQQRYSTIAAAVGCRTIQRILIKVCCGDLVLRDTGYFGLNDFTEIEQREAWWLIRLPLTTSFLLADGRALEKYLKSYCKDIIDLLAVRLILPRIIIRDLGKTGNSRLADF